MRSKILSLSSHLECSRRGADTSGDIDCLITHPKFEENSAGKDYLAPIVARLKSMKFLTDDLVHGRYFHIPILFWDFSKTVSLQLV
jgi:hypothetical protein